MYGICNLSVIPCRKEPSDKSEMVTQLLFGEHFKVLEDFNKTEKGKKSWLLIKLLYDGYECWVDGKQIIRLSDMKNISDSNTAIATDIVQMAEEQNGKLLPILLGSSLPKFSDKKFIIGKKKYSYEGEVIFPFKRKSNIPSKREVACWYLHAPYLWGGRSPFGIDCSGFTQMVFKICGIKLKRDAWQQAEQGTTVNFLEETQEGDLAFFDNEEGKIVHVGMVLEGGKIIHASGQVRIDNLDHHGIYNSETKTYTHRLRIIKRI